MAITQYRDWNWLAPWGEFDQVTCQLNRFFSDAGIGDVGSTNWLPPVNVEETKNELVLTAELSGIKQEDVEIELENNVPTLRG